MEKGWGEMKRTKRGEENVEMKVQFRRLRVYLFGQSGCSYPIMQFKSVRDT